MARYWTRRYVQYVQTRKELSLTAFCHLPVMSSDTGHLVFVLPWTFFWFMALEMSSPLVEKVRMYTCAASTLKPLHMRSTYSVFGRTMPLNTLAGAYSRSTHGFVGRVRDPRNSVHKTNDFHSTLSQHLPLEIVCYRR